MQLNRMNYTAFDVEHMEDNSRTRNHFKARLRYHIIFSTKYRRKVLNGIKNEVFDAFNYSVKKDMFEILNMNVDQDHIHFLLSINPTVLIGDVIARMKQMSTHYLYRNCIDHLKKFYWGKKKILWTHGYFISTTGLVSESVVFNYIENQGSAYYNL